MKVVRCYWISSLLIIISCSLALYLWIIDYDQRRMLAHVGISSSKHKAVMHVAVVLCGGNRLQETLIMMKSALLLSKRTLHFHAFVDDDNVYVDEELRRWPDIVKARLTVTLYPVSYPNNIDMKEWRAMYKPCATQRLFLPYMIPEHITDVVLYVDVDVLFMRPIENLWEYLNRFNSTHIAAMSADTELVDKNSWYPNNARHPYYGRSGVNSGVILMHMNRMRQAGWKRHIINYYNQYRNNITLGDQDLINIFFHKFPSKLFVLPCNSNFRPEHCTGNIVNCNSAIEHGMLLLHGVHGIFRQEANHVFKICFDVFQRFRLEEKSEFLLQNLRDSVSEIKQQNFSQCMQVAQLIHKQIKQQLSSSTL